MTCQGSRSARIAKDATNVKRLPVDNPREVTHGHAIAIYQHVLTPVAPSLSRWERERAR
jgi:hypothetical protein